MTEADDAKPKKPKEDEQSTPPDSKANVSDSSQKDAEVSSPSLTTAGQEEPQSQQADLQQIKSENTHKSATKRPRALWRVLWVMMVVFLLAVAWALYFGWQTARHLQEALQHDKRSLVAHEQALQDISAQMQSLRREHGEEKQRLNQQLNEVRTRLSAHNKRLLSLSTTSREDWLLAEAEYLLKLANQRLLIEREGSAADALLSEADAILRDLDDPDLNPVRQALARDLAALRLMQQVDIEGIYFALVALLDQLDNLPLTPTRQQLFEQDELSPVSQHEAQTEAPSLWARLQLSFSVFLQRFGDYIRITRHAPAPNVLVAPMEQDLVRQNTRMLMLRAQIALLQRKTDIYQQSLSQTQKWIMEMYPQSMMASAMVKELNRLADIDIDYQVADISTSLELLRSYIEDLHKLGERSSASESDSQ